jgi:hypothetical protein
MINIQVHYNSTLANSIIDVKFIKSISKKLHTEDNPSIKDKYLVIRDKYVESADTYQLCFKKIINLIPGSTVDKLIFIENMFKGEECFIIAPGPSYNELTEEQKINIFNNYFTIAVKYIIDEFIKYNISPFIYAFSSCKDKKINIYNTTIIYSYFSKKNNKFNINHDLLFLFKNNNKFHNGTFNEFTKNKDPLNIKNNIEIDKDNINYHTRFGHIMYEIAIPICVHLGFSNIYTIGWDCSYYYNQYYNGNNNKITKKSLLHVFNMEKASIENSYFMHKVMKEKYNINIYKSSNSSLVKLPIIDINDII